MVVSVCAGADSAASKPRSSTIQRPLYEAASSTSRDTSAGGAGSSSPTQQMTTPNTSALPNPWAQNRPGIQPPFGNLSLGGMQLSPPPPQLTPTMAAGQSEAVRMHPAIAQVEAMLPNRRGASIRRYAVIRRYQGEDIESMSILYGATHPSVNSTMTIL